MPSLFHTLFHVPKQHCQDACAAIGQTLQSMLSGVELALLQQASRPCRASAMCVPRFYTGLRGLPSGTVVADTLVEHGVVEWGFSNHAKIDGGLSEDMALRRRCRTRKVGRARYYETMLGPKRVRFFWISNRLSFPFVAAAGTAPTIMVSHLRGEWNLTHKHHLGENTTAYWGNRAHLFHPETHVLSCHSRKHASFHLPAAVQARVRQLVAEGNLHRWIIKPSTGSCGVGIDIFSPAEFVVEACDGTTKPSSAVVTSAAAADRVCAALTQLLRNNFFSPEAQAAQVAEHGHGSSNHGSGAESDGDRDGDVEVAAGECKEGKPHTSNATGAAVATAAAPPKPSTPADEQLDVVLQRYIARPFLFNGRKFDIRVYLLVASVDPLLAFFHDGYIRISGQSYAAATGADGANSGSGSGSSSSSSSSSSSTGAGPPVTAANKAAHITNFHVQRELPGYDAATDSVAGLPIRASFSDLLDAIAAEAQRTDRAPPLWPRAATRGVPVAVTARKKMQRAIAQALAAVKGPLTKSKAGRGQYTLLGVDLLLDEAGDFWLLEFTKGPALRMAPAYLKELHTTMLQSLVGLMLEVQRRHDAKVPLAPGIEAHAGKWEKIEMVARGRGERKAKGVPVK